MMKISILGTGAYGLALSFMFHENYHNISMWTAFKEEKELLEKERKYEKVLPNIKIPEEIEFTCDMEKCLENSDLVVLAVPAKAFESVCIQLKKYIKKEPILIASKGIENESLRFLHEIVREHILENNIAVISGPTFAIDMASKEKIALTLASQDEEVRTFIRSILENKYLKIEETNDMVSAEVCGAYKNIVAIGAGILEGLNVSVSTKCRFLTDTFKEMKNLIISLGGNTEYMISYAGFGDFILTCTSDKSRNYTLGKMIGSKQNKETIDEYVKNTTIEGLYTLKSIQKMMNEKNIELSLIPVLSSIIEGKRNPEDIINI